MAEPFVATTQNGDLTGTVAFDGHHRPPLMELAKLTDMPAGYVPVGFHLSGLALDKEGLMSFRIVAVDVRETKDSLNDIIKLGQSGDEVPVHQFWGKVRLADFIAHFKRFDLTVIHKGLGRAKSNVVTYNAP
jgi:hypothetical protein